MGKRKQQPTLADRLRRAEADVKRLVGEKRKLEGQVSEFRRRIGWARNLDPDQRRIVESFHDAIDTLALLADANQAIQTDRIRAKGADQPMFNPVPVWAHNRLLDELDHLAARADAIRAFAHRPTEHRPRRTCRHCHQPLPVAVRRFCDWCGHPLSEPRKADDDA